MTARVRRGLDVVVAGLALVMTLPLLVGIALGVRLTSPGPVLFRQLRVGRGGRPFALLKFRTMRADATGPRITAASDARVTPLGAWLRRWKLDELPQLLHVLRGEMSLIGPRPEVPEYLARLGPAAADYVAVRPGLADAATLAFYDEAERLAAARDPERYYLETILPEKARLSLAYEAQRSLGTDLRLLVALARRVLALLVLVALAGTPARADHVPIRILTADGYVQRARVSLACRPAPAAASRRQPAPLS